MNPNKALWEKGDFTRIAEGMRESGEALVADIGIEPGMQVDDLGCGDGTTALPAARLGAEVVGIDIAEHLVAAGNRRAQAEGLTNCRFQEGDASNLEGVSDDSFDLTLSVFGAMFAPKPFDVAKEMVRVTRTGGRLVMGNWIPNDPTLVAQILKISSAYSPPPPEGFVSPMTWGVESDVTERFTAAGVPKENISLPAGHVPLRLPGPTRRRRRHLSLLLRADHERLRRCRGRRTNRGPRRGTCRAVRGAERERRRRHDVDPGDVPSRDRGRLVRPAKLPVRA